MDIKMEIKKECCFPQFDSQNERQFYPEDHLIKVKNETLPCDSDYKMNLKTEIKEECCVLDFGSQNEGELFTKDFLKKSEVVTNGSVCETDTNLEIEEAVDTKFCSQDEGELLSKDAVSEVNECQKQNEMDSQITFKQEQWLVERGSTNAVYFYEVNLDEKPEPFPSSQSPRLYNGVSSDESSLFSHENFGKDIRINMREDSAKRQTHRTFRSQESVFSEQSESAKMDTKASCLKQNSLNKTDSFKNYIHKSVLVSDIFKVGIIEQNPALPPNLKLHKLDYQDQISNKYVSNMHFPQLPNVKRHSVIDEGGKPHKCDACAKSFTRLSKLNIHKLIHGGTKPQKCDICGKSFAYLSGLREHKLIHEGRKPHKCDTCGKSFTQLSNLNIHKLIHDGRKPHKCDSCGKSFTQSSSLKTHKLIHEGKKPHKCDSCGKSFTDLSGLRNHKFIHEGRKPHKCDTCGKSFIQSSKLNIHKLIHEGRKPHKCDSCEKSFTDLSSLRKHKFIHEGKKTKSVILVGKVSASCQI